MLNRYRLAHEYGNSIEFTDLWDRLQIEGRCCGITGPQVSKIYLLYVLCLFSFLKSVYSYLYRAKAPDKKKYYFSIKNKKEQKKLKTIKKILKAY